MKNKIVFFGTPPFAAQIFSYLLDKEVPIVAAVTKPDRPQGRSLQVAPSAVKRVCMERGLSIPLFQPEKASEEPFLKDLAAVHGDLFVVAAFGQILPQKLLSIPPFGCINVHPSLLPKYRGAAPIRRCLMAGETETGVAIQKMVKQLDAGDVIATTSFSIPSEMTFGELEEALCALSKPLLLRVLQQYEEGIPPATPQDPTLATHAPKIEPEEGEIHWKEASEKIHNLIRAFSPRPGAWCWVEEKGGKKRLKILRSRLVDQTGAPGHLLSKEGIIGCGRGALLLLEVQPEGKKILSAADWLRGFPSFQKFS